MASSNRTGSSRPHLVLRLRKGWTFEPGSRCFRREGRDSFRPGEQLPKYTRIAFQVPAMVRKRRRTPAEDELARGILIVPPKSVPLGSLLERIQSWPCVGKAWIAPTISPAAPADPNSEQ